MTPIVPILPIIPELPILMCGEMVRATLDDLKTETRRPFKTLIDPNIGCELAASELSEKDLALCPYGKPGERLWVKETFQICRNCHTLNCAATCNERPLRSGGAAERRPGVCSGCDQPLGHWKPSIFMRRIYVRLVLELTAVRVERVQTITAAGVLAEGVRLPTHEGRRFERVTGRFLPSDYLKVKPFRATDDEWLVAHYASLWDSINAKKYPWNKNPYVWVLTFKRCSGVSAERR